MWVYDLSRLTHALCAGIDRPLTEHAAALAIDAGPQSLRTGDRLIRMVDAGCRG